MPVSLSSTLCLLRQKPICKEVKTRRQVEGEELTPTRDPLTVYPTTPHGMSVKVGTTSHMTWVDSRDSRQGAEKSASRSIMICQYSVCPMYYTDPSFLFRLTEFSNNNKTFLALALCSRACACVSVYVIMPSVCRCVYVCDVCVL